MISADKLKPSLERLYKTYSLESLSTDPLEFVHRFKSNKDREVAGLIASSLAYGKVSIIRSNITKIMEAIDYAPFSFVMSFDPKKDKNAFAGFVHRFNNAADMRCLMYFIRQMIEAQGSIGNFFLKGFSGGHENVKESLASFSKRALALDTGGIYGTKTLPEKAGVRFFFPSPDDKSPCKRLNLYLRWMIRKDELDFGIWKGISPAKLIIPLDTHIARISKNIGLTSRKSPDWKMAEEITGALKKLDPNDPVKYDFALCRLGIMEKCSKERDPAQCEKCVIKDVCVL